MHGTMKKAVITGKQQAALVDMPIPQPVADWALVKMTVVPMCTEYKGWLRGPNPGAGRINALGGQIIHHRLRARLGKF